MIPTLIILGVMLGMVPRGWVGVAIVVIGWPMFVIATGTDGGGTRLFFEAAAVAGGNTAIGFVAGLVLLRPIATWIVDRVVP